MFRLTREVRFAAGPLPNDAAESPTNGHAGFPTITALAPWYALRVTLAGELDPRTSYLRNIQDIDAVVREHGIPIVRRAVTKSSNSDARELLRHLFDALKTKWPRATLDRLEFVVSPFTALSVMAEEYPMIRVSQKFEFSASHRLHDERMTDAENRTSFGKCNNPAGHGHNYEVQVTVRREDSDLSVLPAIERAVKPAIDRLDHRHLNLEVAEFRTLNPTVENIAKVIFGWLKVGVAGLETVTVWETPKTWCEYAE